MNEFTPQQIAAVILRDGGICAMTGTNPLCTHRAETANHRLNRSTGGTNSLANAAAICHVCNGLIESDPVIAAIARERGVKLRPALDSLASPFWSPFFRQWVTVDPDDECLRLTGDTQLEQEAD